MLLRWEPGAALPLHKHPEIEQSFVLEGSFYDHDGICRAGQYVYRHPGSMHETRSDEGCLLLAVYRKPNVFFNTAGFEAGKVPDYATIENLTTFVQGIVGQIPKS